MTSDDAVLIGCAVYALGLGIAYALIRAAARRSPGQ